jgi:hypothetical protein
MFVDVCVDIYIYCLEHYMPTLLEVYLLSHSAARVSRWCILLAVWEVMPLFDNGAFTVPSGGNEDCTFFLHRNSPAVDI